MAGEALGGHHGDAVELARCAREARDGAAGVVAEVGRGGAGADAAQVGVPAEHVGAAARNPLARGEHGAARVASAAEVTRCSLSKISSTARSTSLWTARTSALPRCSAIAPARLPAWRDLSTVAGRRTGASHQEAADRAEGVAHLRRAIGLRRPPPLDRQAAVPYPQARARTPSTRRSRAPRAAAPPLPRLAERESSPFEAARLPLKTVGPKPRPERDGCLPVERPKPSPPAPQ